MSGTDKNQREFDRQYGNLIELHRRVFDFTRDYPRNTCIIWFINGMAQISSNPELNKFLNNDKIDNIIDMSKHLIRSSITTKENKRDLCMLIKEYQQINTNVLGM